MGLLQTAMTSKSALEGTDYERLETLGDGFIKYAVRPRFCTGCTDCRMCRG